MAKKKSVNGKKKSDQLIKRKSRTKEKVEKRQKNGKPTKLSKKAATKNQKPNSNNKMRLSLSEYRKKLKQMPLRVRLKEQLKSSRFRYFNEQFYISSSADAQKYFTENPSEFKAYHDGYEQQAAVWPIKPVDVMIKELQRRPKTEKPELVADFGCGKAQIARSLNGKFKFFSFDLVAINELVTACNMSNTNLFNCSVDIAIFCLSLMGSNISEYIKEANRVLKEGGLMKIAEVKSRFDKVDDFIMNIESFGFSLLRKDITDPYFYYFDFKKKTSISKSKKKKLPEVELKPCLYKNR